jgi:hypothetical protein
MTVGLFKSFSHDYRLSEIDGRTVLEDEFLFESPGGFIGRFFDRHLLTRAMRRAQDERLQAIKAALESGTADAFLK